MWHVNPQAKTVGVCRAEVRACPYGEANHFENSEKAYGSIYEAIPTLKKSGEDYRNLKNFINPYTAFDPYKKSSRYRDAQARVQKKFNYTGTILKAMGILTPASVSILMPPPVTIAIAAVGVAAVTATVIAEVKEDREEVAASRRLIETVETKQAEINSLVQKFAQEASLSPQEAKNLLHTM